jgi:hypothetical protein
LRFILDNNLSPRLARALNALTDGNPEVHHLRDKFDADTPDVEWIQELSSQGNWVVVTEDRRILTRIAERDAFRTAHLTGYFLDKAWCRQTLWVQAEHLVRWWPVILEFATKVTPGHAYGVPLKGRKLKPLM